MRKVKFCVNHLLLFCVIAAMAPGAQALDGCRATDINGDDLVDSTDLAQLIGAFGTADARKDLDGSGSVDDSDLSILLSFFGSDCTMSCPADLNADGSVDGADRALVEANFGLDCRFDLDRDGLVDGDGKGDDDDTDLLLDYWGAGPLNAAQSRADFNADGNVDSADLALLLPAISRDCRFDINKDGAVDTNDIWALLASWGSC